MLMLDCAAGRKLAPFVNGFLEPDFQREVKDFVVQHAPGFAVACPDGSYPLSWTELHKEYQQLFERQFNSVIQEEGFSRQDFHDYCSELQQAAKSLSAEDSLPGFPGIRVKEFQEFLQASTASQDFDRFLIVMSDAYLAAPAEVSQMSSAAPELAQAATSAGSAGYNAGYNSGDVPIAKAIQELDVAVPDGVEAGQTFAVDYLGVRYELLVPEGCGPGSVFRASITLPSV